MDQNENIPVTEGQVRTLLHKFPVDETLAMSRKLQFRYVSAAYLVGVVFMIGLGIYGYSQGITILIPLAGVLVLAIALPIRVYAAQAKQAKFLNQHKNMQRVYAFDPDWVWIASNEGQFSKNPWDMIYTTTSTEHALLLALTYNSFIYIPWSTIPDEHDREKLKAMIREKSKSGSLSLMGTFKQ